MKVTISFRDTTQPKIIEDVQRAKQSYGLYRIECKTTRYEYPLDRIASIEAEEIQSAKSMNEFADVAKNLVFPMTYRQFVVEIQKRLGIKERTAYKRAKNWSNQGKIVVDSGIVTLPGLEIEDDTPEEIDNSDILEEAEDSDVLEEGDNGDL